MRNMIVNGSSLLPILYFLPKCEKRCFHDRDTKKIICNAGFSL